jgi:polysaccharide biosynthesis transport protein
LRWLLVWNRSLFKGERQADDEDSVVSREAEFDVQVESDTLTDVLRVLRRRWMVVAGVVLACLLVAVVKHAKTTKSYQATASVAFQSGTLSDAALQVSPSGSSEPQREADTEVLVAHSSEVARGVSEQLHISTGPSELLNEVKVEAAPNANVLNIVASSGDPSNSARLANAFAEQYIAFRARSELAGIGTAQSKLQQQISALPAGSPERAALQQSLQRLGELRAVAGGGANVIGSAAPPGSPSGMGLSTTVAIGLLVGLALSFSLVFLLEALDRRIKSIEEFERAYRLPALASIPQSVFGARRAKERQGLLEPVRMLRSALDFAAVTHQLDTLIVTSAVSGEGKTTVAVDLAQAVALAGHRVVLVELDLRRPTFGTHFNLDSRGLMSALAYGESLSEMLVEPFADLPNFSVLPAGPLPPNPSELLGTERIAEMLSEFAHDGAMVIIDAPPLNPVADAQVLLNNPSIHAAIVVARLNHTTLDEARLARSILDRHTVDPVGIVVTGLRDASRYGYESVAPSGKSARVASSALSASIE